MIFLIKIFYGKKIIAFAAQLVLCRISSVQLKGNQVLFYQIPELFPQL